MAISNKYDFVLLFDVENGNPNGDPDAGNAPRTDPDTGLGFVTDVCIKRKIRNYVDITRGSEQGFAILVKPEKALNTHYSEAYDELGLKKGQKGKNESDLKKARAFMCENYFDVRAFGMVMSTGDDPCGIVRGPVQINFARSISRINPMEITITRQARTTEALKETGNTEMGRKNIIPYALYRAEGYISACLAQRDTGFSDEDLALLWEAVINMFEEDHSAARGKMCVRGLYVFRHENMLGNCPSYKLFDKISVCERTPGEPPRSFSDYEVTVDTAMPEGVTLSSMI